MNGYQITAEERAALRDLQHLWRVLYHELRGRMDFRTGKVGIKPEISWQALREDTYVNPGPGIQNSGSPSKDQLRRAAAGLVRVGLVEMESNEAQRKLIFSLPMARRNSFVQKQPAINPPDQPARQAKSEKRPQPARPRQAEPATHREDSISIHHHHLANAENSRAPEYQWTDSLSESDRKSITKMLHTSRANGTGQMIIDEVTARLEKGAIQKGSVAYASGIINRFQSGTFEQSAEGAAIARRRAKASQVERNTTTEPRTDSPASKDAARAHIEAMRDKMKGGKR